MRLFRSFVLGFLVMVLLGTVLPVYAGQHGGEFKSEVDWQYRSPKLSHEPVVAEPPAVQHAALLIQVILRLFQNWSLGRVAALPIY
jgi:hypothetical protein